LPQRFYFAIDVWPLQDIRTAETGEALQGLRLLTDEELAARVNTDGDRAAEEMLVGRYLDLAAIIARSFPISGHDYEDIAAEAQFAIVKAIREYRDGKGASFATWFRRIVLRSLTDLYRKSVRKKEFPLRVLVNIDATVSEGGYGDDVTLIDAIPNGDDVESEVLDEISREEVVSLILSGSWAPIRDAIAGLSIPQIAQSNNMSESAVERHIVALQTFARAFLPEVEANRLAKLLNVVPSQPALFEVPYSPEQAVGIARAAYDGYIRMKLAVLNEISQGYSLAEVAANRGIEVAAIKKILSASSELITVENLAA
jgi:RNA polymerase sporulation-specific sigma factor